MRRQFFPFEENYLLSGRGRIFHKYMGASVTLGDFKEDRSSHHIVTPPSDFTGISPSPILPRYSFINNSRITERIQFQYYILDGYANIARTRDR